MLAPAKASIPKLMLYFSSNYSACPFTKLQRIGKTTGFLKISVFSLSVLFQRCTHLQSVVAPEQVPFLDFSSSGANVCLNH